MTLTSNHDETLLPLVRNNFWHGKLMGVQEFQRDQQYLLSLQRTLSRLTVGAGVLCGLRVEPDGLGLRIGSGAALDGHGRLIVVSRSVQIDDVTSWVCPTPASGSLEPGVYELCVLHHECPTDPAPALVTDCDTRIECRPGAIEERYRVELRLREREDCDDVCADCCKSLEPGRECSCESDCVELATVTWGGSAIVGVSMEHRSEIPSTRDLYESQRCRDDACDDTSIRAPRLVELWPTSGSTLSREGSPSAWARWRLWPRVELHFDRAIDEDRVDDTRDWIRAWAVANDPTTSAVMCERLELTYHEDVPDACCGHDRVVVAVDDRSLARFGALTNAGSGRLGVVIQARSNFDTGPLGVAPVTLPAQLQHAGTTLTTAQLDELWDKNEVPDMSIDALHPQTLPPCFTDGFDGGRLHSVFYLDAVSAELRLTAVHPYSGARVESDGLTVQASFARPIRSPADDWLLDATNPWLRAWLFADDGTVERLSVAAAKLVERPRIADLFRGDFDATLRQELAGTVELELSAPVATSGRLLVVSRSPIGGPGQSIGSFGGTCLGRDELLDLWNEQSDASSLRARVRPSGQRLPRASQSDGWIHWTFAWEKT
jgi:hypothetical protein